ncbi:MAG: M48 family metallopeptidase [Rhodospirillaceae bacterium]|nr:M48 family metallopeptidase [Rhodospirillaceae bacterium]
MSVEDATQEHLAALSPEALAAAKAYTTGGYWLILWGLLVTVLVTVVLVRWDVLAKLRDRIEGNAPRPRVMTFAVAAAFLGLSWLLELPWSIYTGWARERAYNLSQQPFSDWIMQNTISTAVNMLLGGLFFMGLYTLIRRTPRRWWMWGGAFAGVALVFGLLIAPVFIMPLFNNYTPMADGLVKEAVVALAKDSHVPTDKIFVFDGSRQRSILTANVSGVGGTAQISVSDVALKEATLPEVRAVVGHEIGHYVSKDVYKIVGVVSVLALIGFWLSDRLFGRVATALGAHDVRGISDPAGIPVLLLMVSVWLTLCQPIINSMTRVFEAEADAYSLQHAQEPDGLASALVKTAEYRDPLPDPLAEILFHNHPSVANRVRMAMEWKAAHAPAVEGTPAPEPAPPN